jgi:hypothetical protein
MTLKLSGQEHANSFHQSAEFFGQTNNTAFSKWKHTRREKRTKKKQALGAVIFCNLTV